MARVLVRELEPFGLMWVEEPLLPEHSDLLPALAASTSIPIAAGERMHNRWDFKALLSGGGVSVVQPDVSMTGLFEMEKITRMAEAYDVAVAPHCPLGPITLAASLQIDLSIQNFLVQEQSLGIEYNKGNELLDYLVDPSVFAFTDGSIAPLTGVGLGIELDEERVRAEARTPHNWRSPLTFHPDGSFAEW
jgi:galactonate dehydratase